MSGRHFMEGINTATNIPFKAPAEIDGQNRLQSTQQQSGNDSSSGGTNSSGDTVTISAQAQSMSRLETTNQSPANQQMSRVNNGQNAQNVQQDPQTNYVDLPAQQQFRVSTQAGTMTNTPQENFDSINPAETRTATRTETATGLAPSDTTDTTTTTTLRAPTSPLQTPAPQSTSTPLQPAQESPVAAAAGLAPARISINLTV